jgi:microsomal epoxide hydrolase
MMHSLPRKFRVAVPDESIADLHARLDRARWPDQLEGVGWDDGTELASLRGLVDHWRHAHDWRAAEAQINAFDQFLLEIDGLDLHFLHQRSPHDGAVPLILTHGWPGSIVEFIDLIPRLVRPELFGGRPEDAFHVVCPSLPGYGWSAPARRRGMHIGEVARRHAALMAALGYDAYIAQGGDWGSGVSLQTAAVDPEHCRAVHVNLLALRPPKSVADPQALITADEQPLLQRAAAHQRDGTAYMLVNNTRPQSLGYALQDSPVGLCAWIAEKFQAWSDGGGDPCGAVSRDRLLTNVSLYWYSGSIVSSLRLYRETYLAQQARLLAPLPAAVPLGVAVYPHDIYHAPRAWAQRQLNVVHWFRAERGGHFAAMEQPQVFAEDLWRFKQAAWTPGNGA